MPAAQQAPHRRFVGRRVLVTGGSSGIGQAIAVGFAAEGARVSVNYHSDQEGAEETLRRMTDARERERLPTVADLVLQGDVSEEGDVDRLFDATLAAFGGLDVLINNAGIQTESPSHEADVSAFDRPIAVNLRGPFLCCRRATRHFCERGDGGVILNISSVHERIPKPLYAGYAASKGGLRNLTRTLALEYAGQGIRVNAVAPGAVITPINESWASDPEERKKVSAHIPIGRPAGTDEITPAVLFLASEEARYITGQTLFVDGGLTLYPDFRTTWSS